MNIEDSYNDVLLAEEIKKMIKDSPEIQQHGVTISLNNSNKRLHIEIDGNYATIQWYENDLNSFYNDDYIFRGIDYKVIKTHKLNWRS